MQKPFWNSAIIMFGDTKMTPIFMLGVVWVPVDSPLKSGPLSAFIFTESINKFYKTKEQFQRERSRIMMIMKVTNPWILLSTRDSMYENLPVYIRPEEVVLRSVFKRRKGRIIEVRKKGSIIPFEKSLMQIITIPEVWHFISHPSPSHDGIMRDVTDGDMVKNIHWIAETIPHCI